MRLRLLGDVEVKQIHQTALQILNEIGILVMDQDTRQLLKDAGCRESDENFILYDNELVEKSLASVPNKMLIYDRNGEIAVDSGGDRPYFSPGVNCIDVLDYRTGEHRSCTLKDVEETAKLCDRLANIDMVANLGNPNDLPPSEQAMASVRALATATRKPLAFIAHDEVEAKEIWNYLADLAGGWEAFSAKPFALDLTGPRSPLELGEEACRRLRFAARRRLPVVCYPALISGAGGPITLAGALAQSAAEILGGIVVHQLEQPGAPVISGSAILPMDMRSGQVSYGSPEYTLACLGAVDYYSYLGVPSWFGAGCTDSHIVDIRAAAEAAMSLQTAVSSGTSVIHNLGYMSSGRTGSLEMLVLCDELAGMAKRFAAGIQVNEDTLALDATRRAYKDHAFITDPHTLKHVRTAMWKPSIFRRYSLEDWQASGSEELQKQLREKVGDLLAS